MPRQSQAPRQTRQPWNRNLLHPGICDPCDRGERDRDASALLSADPNAKPPSDPVSGFTGRLPSSIFANVRMLSAALARYRVWCPRHRIWWPRNLVLKASAGPSLFVTSNQCASCHDATDNTPMPTHMLYPDATRSIDSDQPVDLWRMALFDDGAGGPRPRSSSPNLIPNRPYIPISRGKLNPPGFIQDTCLSLPRSDGTAPVPPGQRKRTAHAIHARSIE